MIKKILLFLLFALIIIQFIHPKKNKSEPGQPNYIGHKYPVPENVKAILDKACMDCHSNNTRYPWYCSVQPVHWWIGKHINNGKKQINFDEYSSRNLRFQYHKMEEVAEQVKEGEMPLNSYTWLHKDAILSAEEKKILIDWSNSVRDNMKAQYPMDSLVRKK